MIQHFFHFFFALILLSNLSYCQWYQQTSGTNRHLWGISFVNSNTGTAVGLGATILRTTNGGSNWIQQVNNDTNGLLNVKMIDPSNIFAVGEAATILHSTNGGLNWVRQTSPFFASWYGIAFVNANTGYVVGDNTRIIKTVNAGDNWILLSVPYNDLRLHSVSFPNADTGFTVGDSHNSAHTVFFTSNAGANWERRAPTNPLDDWLYGVYFLNTTTGMITGDNFTYLTTNCGINWTRQNTGGSQLGIVLINANTAYSVGIAGRILYTTNAGTNWLQQPSGTNLTLRGIAFTDAVTGTIVGDSGRILHTTNGGVSAIEPTSGEIPRTTYLSQNYPNPFNSITRIKFGIDSKVLAKLVVIDLLGKEIAVIVKQSLNPGTYEYSWDASIYSSGIYFYRLLTDTFTKTKKLIILK